MAHIKQQTDVQVTSLPKFTNKSGSFVDRSYQEVLVNVPIRRLKGKNHICGKLSEDPFKELCEAGDPCRVILRNIRTAADNDLLRTERQSVPDLAHYDTVCVFPHAQVGRRRECRRFPGPVANVVVYDLSGFRQDTALLIRAYAAPKPAIPALRSVSWEKTTMCWSYPTGAPRRVKA